jgi:hypothetical protein
MLTSLVVLQWQSLKGDMISSAWCCSLLPVDASHLTPVVPDPHGFQQQPEASLLMLLEVEVEPLVVQL